MGPAVPWGSSSSEELPAVGVPVRSAHAWARSSVSCPALRCSSSPSLAAVFLWEARVVCPPSFCSPDAANLVLHEHVPVACFCKSLGGLVRRGRCFLGGGPRWTPWGRWCLLVSVVSSPDTLLLCGTFTGAAGGLASSSVPPFPCWRPVLGEAFLRQLPDCLGGSWRKSEVVLVSLYSPVFRVKSVPLTRASGSVPLWTQRCWRLAPWCLVSMSCQ